MDAPHPAKLPRGEVTFLFTDIEGSTRLWERDAAVMWRALERHNAILSATIREHHGYHFKTIGDAFQAAFSDAGNAVAAAIAAQRALNAEPWPDTGPLRVRMALHRGPAEPLPEGDYPTPGLGRLARLMSAGHGGQVLLSAAVREAVGEDLPEGVSVASLGKHRLGERQELEEVWQLVITGLPANFPPLKGLEQHPTNLPRPTTSLIGREEEIVALADLLDDEGPHVVTLTGPGGVGKTRLALAAATRALEAFQDGAFLVALSGIEDAELLLPEIAAVLGVREGGGLSLEESVFAYLGSKRLLLVLDNLEQLQPFEAAAALVARLLTMRVMATSRAPLRIRAEREWPVAPLPIPELDLELDEAGPDALGALAAVPAVALFIDRARAARPAWRLTPGNAKAVAEIARRLDGLPLAIELAAARVRVFTPAEIVKRLGDALDLLQAGGERPDRQQTLRATIAWSHELLSFENQAAFRRLGVFSGGFTLEAAEKVLAAAPDPWIDVLDAVSILVEQNLIRAVETSNGETRYDMLETIRTFALEALERAKEGEPLRRAHAAWAEKFARDSERHVLGPRGGEWLERLEVEHDNFRSAMVWAIESDPSSLGLRLPESLWRFWDNRGHFAEARSWLDRALKAGQDAPAGLRAQALQRMGSIAWRQGDLPAAARALEASVGIWRKLDDRPALARALTNLGIVADMQGDTNRALALQEEAFAIVRETGDPLELAGALNNLALMVWNNGDIQRAVTLLEESVAIRRREHNLAGLSAALNNLGMLAAEAGDPSRAIAYLEEALSIDRELGSPNRIADMLSTMAGLVAPTGDIRRAAALDVEALELRRELDDVLGFAYGFESIAATALHADAPANSARLIGAADRLREELGAPLPPPERAGLEKQIALARSAMGDAAFNTAWAAGRGTTLEEAIADALRVAQEMANAKGASA